LRFNLGLLISIFLNAGIALAGPICQLHPMTDPYEFYRNLAEAFVPTDDAITAVARNTSVCDIVEGKRCTKAKPCHRAREKAVIACRDGVGYSIGDNVKDSVEGTGSLKLCYRGVKEMLGRLYGPEVREKLVGAYAKNAANDFNKLGKYFTKVKINSEEAKTTGTVCILSGGRYGHIEMLGSDGNYYSDFNQGPRSVAGGRYKKTACYVPTELAKEKLRMRLVGDALGAADLLMPADGGPQGEDQIQDEEGEEEEVDAL
jgi:hypothetical protein